MVVDPATQIRATVVALFDSLSSSSAVSDSFSCIGKILIASFISALSCTAPRSLLKLLCSISKRDQDGHNDSTYKRDFLIRSGSFLTRFLCVTIFFVSFLGLIFLLVSRVPGL